MKSEAANSCNAYYGECTSITWIP